VFSKTSQLKLYSWRTHYHHGCSS